MDFELNADQKAVRDMARKFADEVIAPGVRERDIKHEFHADIVKKLAEVGLLGGPVPEKYGGAGLDYISHAIVTEEVGRVDSAVRTTLSVHISLVELTILRYASEEQKRRYLPELTSGRMIGCYGLTEPDAGSDAANQQTTAVKTDTGWLLNGNKMWISNGGVSDLALVFAQTDKPRGHKGIACFLVPTDAPGFSAPIIEGKLGLWSSNTTELVLENVEVSDDALMGEVGDGFKIAMGALDSGRYSVAAGCVGIAQGCVDASVKYATEREAFGRKIAGFQLVQELIADMVVQTEAARLLTWKAGHVKNQGESATFETSVAKYYATEAALKAAGDAIRVHGGYGYSNEYPVERFLRDAQVNVLYEGTSQIQKLIIGSHVTGVRAFT